MLAWVLYTVFIHIAILDTTMTLKQGTVNNQYIVQCLSLSRSLSVNNVNVDNTVLQHLHLSFEKFEEVD